MKILIVTPYLPWPLDAGGKAAQYATLLALAEDHTFIIVCPARNVNQIQHAQELEHNLPHVTIRLVFNNSDLLVGDSDIAPRWNQAFVHRLSTKLKKSLSVCKKSIKRAMYAFLRVDDQNSHVSSSEATELAPYFPFRPLSPNLITEVRHAIQECPDVVQIEFADMLSISAWLPKHIPRIFVHHQLHWVYAERFLESCGSLYGSYIKDYMKTIELAQLRNFNAVITFSETDLCLLRSEHLDTPMFVSPFPVPSDVEETPYCVTPFSNTYLFLGSSEHFPNRQGVEWLIGDIWPKILSNVPNASLQIIGSWEQPFASVSGKDNIRFLGFVENLSTVMKGGVLLVPLKIGSGIRMKILAAMAQYVPVVSTSIGCEGLPLTPNTDILVRDSAIGFAEGAVRLAVEPELFANIAISARHVVDTTFSRTAVAKCRNQIYRSVSNLGRGC